MSQKLENPSDGSGRRPAALSVYLGAAASLLRPGDDDAVRQKHREDVTAMLSGLRKYQDHSYRRAMPALDEWWRTGTVRLLRCPASGGDRDGAVRPVLLIPSMINGAEIMDIQPRQSFVRWMAGQGFDVFLLDWGRMADDTDLQTMDGVIVARICAAASALRDHYGIVPGAVGYCMGGTLLAGAAVARPDLFGRRAFLSAPWDFHAGDPRMAAQVVAGAASALQMIEAGPTLPMDWVQKVFAAVNPPQAMRKFRSFLNMTPESTEEQMFIAVEDWLNGGYDLPGGVARVCIMDWYGRNHPPAGKWVVDGRAVTSAALAGHPTMVVAAMKDVLVPPESALALACDVPDAAILKPDCGHISLMAGRNAMETVWRPLSDWLKTG